VTLLAGKKRKRIAPPLCAMERGEKKTMKGGGRRRWDQSATSPSLRAQKGESEYDYARRGGRVDRKRGRKGTRVSLSARKGEGKSPKLIYSISRRGGRNKEKPPWLSARDEAQRRGDRTSF